MQPAQSGGGGDAVSVARLALAQLNTTVGGMRDNCRRMAEMARRARSDGADIVCFPEMAVTGYPPEDLLLMPEFVERARQALEEFLPATRGIIALIGFPERGPDGALHNAAAVAADGRVAAVYRKQCLPNHGVFDEARYFTPGSGTQVLDTGRFRFAVNVCHDIWQWSRGKSDAVERQAAAGAQLLINLSASPYEMGKRERRLELVGSAARRLGAAVALVNQAGGQDELVFDGGSAAAAADGNLAAVLPQFEEAYACVDLPLPPGAASAEGRGWTAVAGRAELPPAPAPSPPLAEALPLEAEVYAALQTGLADFARKCGFSRAGVALSGGVDSALTACLAADALGAENVLGVAMPSRHSSPASGEDAARLAANLGCEFMEVPIDGLHGAAAAAIGAAAGEAVAGTADENLQARLRGLVMMALSNMRGLLCLATGNKSEMAVGYATLYGDMAGGLAPLKDVPKTLVRRLAEWRNGQGEAAPIPRRTLERPPSAELRPGQLDTDSLPDYDALDAMLEEYVERRSAGGAEPRAAEVRRMVDGSEHKRRQAPPGIKITPLAFGRDRRMPIARDAGDS